jgi:hypothetical protein
MYTQCHRASANLYSVAVRHPDNVIVEVGPDRVKYPVSRKFLRHYSEYFNGIAQEPVLDLHEIEIPVWNVFLEWLLTQRLPTNDEEWKNGSTSPAPRTQRARPFHLSSWNYTPSPTFSKYNRSTRQ